MSKKNSESNFVEKIKQAIITVVSAILIFYFATTMYSLIKNPTDVFVLEKGTLFLEEETEGLIIREEQVIKGENYENGMLQIKTEGERVAKGESIFRYYSNEENELKQKITETEIELQEKLQNSDETMPSDVALLETQIKTQIGEISNISDLQKIQERKRDINTALAKKIEIIGETTKNSEIKKIIKQKKNYENELSSNFEYVYAPVSGVVSYRVDNLEDVLVKDDFSYLSKEFMDNLKVRAGQIIATSEESGKIINNFESYIAVDLTSDAAKAVKVGDKLTLQLSNSEEIDAEVSYVKSEGEKSKIIVFKITKKIEELVKYRKISLSVIWWKFNGFKVPNSAIVTENDKFYLIRNRTGYKDKILVKIVKQNEKYSIVNNYTAEELKDLGYSKNEIDNMKNLELYDEIIIENTN